MDKIFCSFVKATGWPLQKIAFRTKIYYKDKRVQNRHIDGPAVIVSNHNYVWDYVAIMFAFWTRNISCLVADITANKNWFIKNMMRWMGNVVINRESKNLQFIDKAVEALKKGGVLEIFPEGRLPIQSERGNLLPFTTSAAYIAYLANVKIIPVYLSGNYFKKKRNKMVIGTPIFVKDIWDEKIDDKTNIQSVTDYMRNKILELKNAIKEKT